MDFIGQLFIIGFGLLIAYIEHVSGAPGWVVGITIMFFTGIVFVEFDSGGGIDFDPFD